MQHLDEGLIMALLDGELPAVEQREVEAHLASCAECSSRLAEVRLIMAEADGLVEELVVPQAPVQAPARQRSRWISGRNLAWAASVVAALGLGLAGGGLFLERPASRAEVAISPRPADAPLNQATPLPAEESSASTSALESAGQVASRQPPAGAGLGTGQTRPSAESDRLELDRSEERAADAVSLAPNAFGESSSAKMSIRGERADSVRPPFQSLADPAGRAAPAAASPLIPRDEVTSRQRLDGDFRAADLVFRPIAMEEAVRQLGGVIRLVDGLTPEEFEVAAADSAQPLVRVTYRVGRAETRLFLEQRRVDNSFVASDLQRLNSTVGQALSANRLSWNDLGGFSLTLSGLLSPDSLFHFKSLVK